MPYVNVKMHPGRSAAQKRALTERLVSAVTETCDVSDPARVTVIIEEVPKEDWQAVARTEIEAKQSLQTHP